MSMRSLNIRSLNILAVLMTLVVAVAVQRAKSDVQDRKDRLDALVHEIREQREAIRVLNAEWAMLSSPDMLQDRSYRFLALMPLRTDQIVDSAEAIPMRLKGEDAAEDGGILRPSVAKRLKNGVADRTDQDEQQEVGA